MQTILLTLKDVMELTGYRHVMTGYQMLRAAGVEPVECRRLEGSTQPVNLYRADEVRRVFADRLAKVQRAA